jgi:hypothetical protein
MEVQLQAFFDVFTRGDESPVSRLGRLNPRETMVRIATKRLRWSLKLWCHVLVRSCRSHATYQYFLNDLFMRKTKILSRVKSKGYVIWKLPKVSSTDNFQSVASDRSRLISNFGDCICGRSRVHSIPITCLLCKQHKMATRLAGPCTGCSSNLPVNKPQTSDVQEFWIAPVRNVFN